MGQFTYGRAPSAAYDLSEPQTGRFTAHLNFEWEGNCELWNMKDEEKSGRVLL
jgi:hypothetical protein